MYPGGLDNMSNLLFNHIKLTHLPETNDCPDVCWFKYKACCLSSGLVFARRHLLPTLLSLYCKLSTLYLFFPRLSQYCMPWTVHAGVFFSGATSPLSFLSVIIVSTYPLTCLKKPWVRFSRNTCFPLTRSTRIDSLHWSKKSLLLPSLIDWYFLWLSPKQNPTETRPYMLFFFNIKDNIAHEDLVRDAT